MLPPSHAILLCLFCASTSFGQPVRLAVIGDGSAQVQGWTDLLTAQIAPARDVALVERERLASIGDEQLLKGVLARRDDRQRAASLVGADVLALVTDAGPREHKGRPLRRAIRLETVRCVLPNNR